MAAMPSPSGISRSIRTTSGSTLAATARAVSPPSASPTTSMSGWSSRNARRPSRTTAWSSTSSTRMGSATGHLGAGGEEDADRGPGAAVALDRKGGVDVGGALAHRCQAHGAKGPGQLFGVEARALVGHNQLGAGFAVAEDNFDAYAAGVLE